MATDEEYERLRSLEESTLSLTEYIRLRVREKVDAERARCRIAEAKQREASDTLAAKEAELQEERHLRNREETSLSHRLEDMATRADRAEARALELESMLQKVNSECDALRGKGVQHDALAATKDNLSESVRGLEKKVETLEAALDTTKIERDRYVWEWDEEERRGEREREKKILTPQPQYTCTPPPHQHST